MTQSDPDPPSPAGATERVLLTRESIRSGQVHRLIAAHGVHMRVLSADELEASRRAALAGVDVSAGVWLFGYGSLIWNPAFHFTDRLTGRIWGYHRRFCLWTHLGRGRPERPGLVLGLERGGSCQGVVFHIAPASVEEEIEIVWRREMLSGAYLPRWVEVRTAAGRVRAIAFVINPAHERYAHLLSDDEIADVIATAEGWLGPCADYLVNTVDHLAALGIHDRPLERLRARVLALRTSGPGHPPA
jgi:glutathione-specific gamma-glutamylcyclotransferase